MSIKCFVGLKSKTYTFTTEDNHKSNKTKFIHRIHSFINKILLSSYNDKKHIPKD